MTHVSIAFVAGLSVASLVALLSLICIPIGIWWRREDPHYGMGGMLIVGAAIALAATVGLSLWAFYPYDMQYHQYRKVTGTVQNIQARMLAENKGTTQQYALKLDKGTYRCDDSRCSLLKPGDPVALWCIRDWQYSSESGWRCRWGGGDV